MILTSTSQLPHPPKRIISLVPSQTELLYFLGLEEQTIGITKFCIHPDHWFRNKIRVGGTKTVDIQKIESLHPDLIIANKEENIREQVEELAKNFNVWVTDVNNLDQALEMINDIGAITNTKSKSNELSAVIKDEFSRLEFTEVIPAAYLIWQEPYMTIGGDTFISDMMARAGFKNVFRHLQRYPEITLEDISASGCEVLLLSSEPYPFKEKHLAELQAKLPGVKVILADGEMFSWYGSWLLKSPGYFKKLRDKVLGH